jgi:hypothetical protein
VLATDTEEFVTAHVGTAALGRSAERSSAVGLPQQSLHELRSVHFTRGLARGDQDSHSATF